MQFTIEEFEEMDHAMGGWCLSCGEEAMGVEPDACNYTCEACGKHEVFGAQEVLMMGMVV